MLSYSDDRDHRDNLLCSSLAERMPLDFLLDRQLKDMIIHRPSELPKELLNTKPIAEAVRQVGILRNMAGIVLADNEKELAEADFEGEYKPAFLCESQCRRIPKSRRIAMARSLLEIMCELEENGIYPGIVGLSAMVYDKSGASDRVYLACVSRFQLGLLRQTWEGTDEENFKDYLAMTVQYPFFDSECQHVAYARLINRLINDKRLAEALDEDDNCPDRILQLLDDMQCELLHTSARRTGVWVILSDSRNYMDSTGYVEEIALINTMLLSVAPNTEDNPLLINYLSCGRSCDMRGGSGTVFSTGLRRFDGTVIPYVLYPQSSSIPGRNLMNAFVAAEYEMQHSHCDTKLLFLLAPSIKDDAISLIINSCRESDISNSFVVLLGDHCDWDRTVEKENIFSTVEGQDDLCALYGWIKNRLEQEAE